MTKKERTALEAFVDQILLMYLIHKSNEEGEVNGATKLQKLVYLSERKMLGRKLKGFNLHFFRFIHGPFSRQLELDIAWLSEQGVLDEMSFALTSEGGAILEGFSELWKRNRPITNQIDSVARKFAPWALRPLLEYVYNQEHPWLTGRSIRSLKNFAPILYKISAKKAEHEFQITPEELETLDILLDYENYRDVVDPSDEDGNEMSVLYAGV